MKTVMRSNARPTANAHTMTRLGRRPCSGSSGDRKCSRNQTRIGISDQPAASAKSTMSEKAASECERAYTEAIRAPARVFGNRTARRRERRDLSNPRSGPAKTDAGAGAPRSRARAWATKVVPRCVRGFANRVAKMGTALRREHHFVKKVSSSEADLRSRLLK